MMKATYSLTFAGTLLLAFASARAVTLPEAAIPQSCGVQLKGGNNDSGNLDQVHDLGVKWIRRGFIWEAIEKTKGEYNFAEYDRLVKDCRDRDLSIIGCLAFSNKIYGHAKDEPGRSAYAKFAAALVEHYKNEKIIWEIWNEPNTMTFWGRHGKVGNSESYAEEYVGLVKAAVPAMKKANPNCVILGGSVSGLWSASFAWQDFCFQKGVLKTGIDAWSVHPYSTKCPEDYIEGYDKVRKMMVAAGGLATFPMLNTERGFPLGKAEGFSGGDAKMTHEYQAWHLVRQQMIDLLCDIRVTNWYEWSGKEGFSLVSGQEKSKAYDAYNVMIQQLKGYKLEKRLPLESPRDFALQFANGQGGVKLVVWTSPPSGEVPDNAKPHDVELPVAVNGTLATSSIYGEARKVESKNGKLAVTIKGAPQYITVQAGK